MRTFSSAWFPTTNRTFIRFVSNGSPSCFYRAFTLVVSLFLGLSSLTLGQGVGALGVSMPFPAFRTSFITGSTVTIRATTTTPVGTTVTKVEFFLATFTGPSNSKVTVKLGEDETAPYTFDWTIPAGQVSYNELSVKVTNRNNATQVETTVLQSGTGYSRVDVYEPTHNSNRKLYVKADAPAGNTAATLASPVNTIQKAVELTQPGDSVFVMAGTYQNATPDVGDAVVIRRTGTPARWIVFTPYQNDKPKVKFTGYQGFNLIAGAAYIKIQGLEIEGNNQNITLADARLQPGACEGPNPDQTKAGGTPLAKFNGNGVSLNGRNGGAYRPHHVVLANNIVHDCPGGGISAIESDYVTVENNTIYNNAWYTVFGASGISFLNSWNFDNSTETKMIIRNNRTYRNQLYVQWNIGGTGTNCKIFDGNGIILDNNNYQFNQNPLGAYLGKFLVENNVSYLNGGRGINLNYTDNATVLNNTTYQNGQSDGALGLGVESEIVMRYSFNARIYNNIFYGRPGEKVNELFMVTGIQYNNNLTFGYTTAQVPYFFTGNQNITGVDPQFVDATNGDFRLLQTSPAINKGSNVAGQFTAKDLLGVTRPQGIGADIGAYELQGVPITFTEQPASGDTVCAGTDVAISVTVDGPGPIAYQWKKDGVAIEGNASASTATLTLPGVSTADAGSYTVVVTAFNQRTSSAFVLAVNPLPTATLSGTTGVCQNATAPSLTFTGSGGTAPYTFTYSVNGGEPQTVTTTEGNSVTVSQLTGTAGEFSYSLSLVSDATCSQAVSGQSATVSVNAPPTVSFSGLEASYCANASAATLTGSPAGGTFSGTGISGSTFDPATAGIGGPFAITYSYTDGNGCSNTSPSQSVRVIQPVITQTVALSGSSLCAGASLSLTFNVNCPTNASFSAELTDAAGTPLGVSLGPISPGSSTVIIPAGTPTGSYKILVTGSNPMLTSLSGPLSVTGLSANYSSTPTVSSTPACAGSTVRVSFTTRTASCPFPGGTVFAAELSDASGSFASPVSLGTVAAGINANVPIPPATLSGTGYRIRIAATADGSSVYSGPSAAFTVNQPSFTTAPTVSGDNKCAGEGVRLSFSVGCAFFPGNTFTAELSNAAGSFASPVGLGTVTPGALNTVLIPANTFVGTGYKIRVVSSSPLVTSAVSANFKVKSCTVGREIAPETLGLQVRVSPNPSPEGRLRIHVSGVEGQALKVALFNGLGQVVREQSLERASEENTLEWDIARQPQGLYLLRVSGTNDAKTVKVIH